VAEPIAWGLEIVSAGAASEVTGPVIGTCKVIDEISIGEKLLEEAYNVIKAV
jgi:hypothetical protein